MANDTFRCAGHEFEANKWDARCTLHKGDGERCTMTLAQLDEFTSDQQNEPGWAHISNLTGTEADEIRALQAKRNATRQKAFDSLVGA